MKDIGQCLASRQLIGDGRSDNQVGSSPPLIRKLQAGTNTNRSVTKVTSSPQLLAKDQSRLGTRTQSLDQTDDLLSWRCTESGPAILS